jgi:hypothetical protein
MLAIKPQVFETIMLICFGSSWPFAVAKTLRTKTVSSKCIVFLFLIFSGYIFGIIHKLIGPFDHVIWLYVINASMVFTEIILYFLYNVHSDDFGMPVRKIAVTFRLNPVDNADGQILSRNKFLNKYEKQTVFSFLLNRINSIKFSPNPPNLLNFAPLFKQVCPKCFWRIVHAYLLSSCKQALIKYRETNPRLFYQYICWSLLLPCTLLMFRTTDQL